MRRQLLNLCDGGLLVVSSACISAPKETVHLAEVVDSQIAAMQVSHEKFVGLYYDGLRTDVDTFMRERWAPQFLSNVVSGQGTGGKQFREDLDQAYELASFDWSTVGVSDNTNREITEAVTAAVAKLAVEENAKIAGVLIEFSEAAQVQIDKKRAELMEPINVQEARVMHQLRKSYADLQRGSAAIKGYLASAVKLAEEQDQIMEMLGVLDEQRKLLDGAAEASEMAASALAKTDDVQDAISKFKNAMDV